MQRPQNGRATWGPGDPVTTRRGKVSQPTAGRKRKGQYRTPRARARPTGGGRDDGQRRPSAARSQRPSAARGRQGGGVSTGARGRSVARGRATRLRARKRTGHEARGQQATAPEGERNGTCRRPQDRKEGRGSPGQAQEGPPLQYFAAGWFNASGSGRKDQPITAGERDETGRGTYQVSIDHAEPGASLASSPLPSLDHIGGGGRVQAFKILVFFFFFFWGCAWSAAAG